MTLMYIRVMNKQDKRRSKFLSLVLRHRPEAANVELDEQGWVAVNQLMKGLRAKDNSWNMELLRDVVENNNKKRFEFNDSETKIRARQGHSVQVDLGYEEQVPPDVLYHGTVGKYLDSIYKDGLRKMKRHHVHLSADTETATTVGSRRGKPVILAVDAARMVEDGYKFYLSNNGVWLTAHVPSEYLTTN